MTNLERLQDYLEKQGMKVDIVDLSKKPKINNDKQLDQNNMSKNLQDVFSDIFKELGLTVHPLDGNDQESKSNGRQNSSDTQTKMKQKQESTSKQQSNSVTNSQSKIQEIDLKISELKRKIAVEESSANLIQLTLDLASLAEERQKEEDSAELKEFQQNITQAIQKLDCVKNELSTLSNMFKAWNENESNGLNEMYGMKEVLGMQINKIQNHFTQLKQTVIGRS